MPGIWFFVCLTTFKLGSQNVSIILKQMQNSDLMNRFCNIRLTFLTSTHNLAWERSFKGSRQRKIEKYIEKMRKYCNYTLLFSMHVYYFDKVALRLQNQYGIYNLAYFISEREIKFCFTGYLCLVDLLSFD